MWTIFHILTYSARYCEFFFFLHVYYESISLYQIRICRIQTESDQILESIKLLNVFSRKTESCTAVFWRLQPTVMTRYWNMNKNVFCTRQQRRPPVAEINNRSAIWKSKGEVKVGGGRNTTDHPPTHPPEEEEKKNISEWNSTKLSGWGNLFFFLNSSYFW